MKEKTFRAWIYFGRHIKDNRETRSKLINRLKEKGVDISFSLEPASESFYVVRCNNYQTIRKMITIINQDAGFLANFGVKYDRRKYLK